MQIPTSFNTPTDPAKDDLTELATGFPDPAIRAAAASLLNDPDLAEQLSRMQAR